MAAGDMNPSREHQQATGRTQASALQRLMTVAVAPLLRLLVRALLSTCRLTAVRGEQHLQGLIQADRAALLCCWHQRLPYCVGWLLRVRGLQPGFLVSPSRDGELVAAVADGLGVTVLRGSANRTGARALRDMYTVIKSGVSPIIAVDGPHGPAQQAKPGTPLLAQITGAPMLPITTACDRYWQLRSWDRIIVPKPFARVIVHVGEPLECARGQSAEGVAAALAQRLAALTEAADSEMSKTG
ncbi:MAG: lysophospholipid acyltransferase family protein [Salinisphaera sp.]|nr:lysophospholipid acyltransferase family protein [Salinisphaera sp.]